MNASELLNAYPQVPHAVAWVELFLCDAGDPEDPTFGEVSSWQMMMDAKWSPEEVLATIKRALAEEIEEENKGKYREALAEMDLPQFRTYLLGKMGLV
jgi:hypothetical protein